MLFVDTSVENVCWQIGTDSHESSQRWQGFWNPSLISGKNWLRFVGRGLQLDCLSLNLALLSIFLAQHEIAYLVGSCPEPGYILNLQSVANAAFVGSMYLFSLLTTCVINCIVSFPLGEGGPVVYLINQREHEFKKGGVYFIGVIKMYHSSQTAC